MEEGCCSVRRFPSAWRECGRFRPGSTNARPAAILIGPAPTTNYLRALAMELTTLARARGKSNVHNLEREDLVALTIEAAAMAGVPLAGAHWIPGR